MSFEPADFAPYRSELSGCQCDLCYPMGYANRPLAERQRQAAALLAALREGTHNHMTTAERCAIARCEHDARVAAACVEGVSDFRMFMMTRPVYTGREMERFYGLTGGHSLEFVIGTGLGMTPGRAARGEAWWAERRARIDAELAARVPALAAADPRNACVAFRQTGAQCTHHAA